MLQWPFASKPQPLTPGTGLSAWRLTAPADQGPGRWDKGGAAERAVGVGDNERGCSGQPRDRGMTRKRPKSANGEIEIRIRPGITVCSLGADEGPQLG